MTQLLDWYFLGNTRDYINKTEQITKENE